ncbi:hypothetical protein [Streptomyces sp. MAI_2237]
MLYATPSLPAFDARVLEEIASMRRDLRHVVQQPEGDGRPQTVADRIGHRSVQHHRGLPGNGRMSRSLRTLLIARQGVLAPEFSSVEEWLGMPGHTWEYYQVLREVGEPVYSPDRDTLPWVRFNLRAYHEQSQRVRHRVKRSTDVWLALAEHTERLHLAERQLTALHEVAMTGRVRRFRYVKAEALSNQQAVRDIQTLTRTGLLPPVGNTKARHCTVGPAFPSDVLAAAQRRHTITNPYQDAGQQRPPQPRPPLRRPPASSLMPRALPTTRRPRPDDRSSAPTSSQGCIGRGEHRTARTSQEGRRGLTHQQQKSHNHSR